MARAHAQLDDRAFVPRARVAPAPVSSGISFRHLPESSLAEIIKTCQFYEAKCAGSVSPTSPTARFVFDLSRDVQDLVKTLKMREDALAARVQELEAQQQDWRATFTTPSAELRQAGILGYGPSSQPSFVAAKLVELGRAHAQLLSDAAAQEARHQTEVANLRAAMRDAVRAAREQATQDVLRIKTDADAVIAKERKQRQASEVEMQEARIRLEAEVEGKANTRAQELVAQLRQDLTTTKSSSTVAVQTAEQQKAVATAQARAAAEELERLKRTLSSQTAEVHEQSNQMQATIQGLRDELAQMVASKDAEVQAQHEAFVKRLHEERERCLQILNKDTLKALEGENAYLLLRVRELEEMVDALQRAVAHSQQPAASSGPTHTHSRVHGGSPQGPTHRSAAGAKARQTSTYTVRHAAAPGPGKGHDEAITATQFTVVRL